MEHERSPNRGSSRSQLRRRFRWALPALLASVSAGLFVPASLALAAADSAEASSKDDTEDQEPRERRVRIRRGKPRKLRDWHAALPDPVAKQLDQAVNYFANSMRVPAALLAGQAGSMLFKVTELAGQSAMRDPAAEVRLSSPSMGSRVAIYTALWRAHFLFCVFAVCSELTAVLVCSTTHSQILDLSRDELALEPTALDLVIKHVEFEYVIVRVCFFSGLLSFLLAVLSRSVAILGAAPRGASPTGKRELALTAAASMMLVSTLLCWMDVYSEEMTNYEGGWKLLRRFCKLVYRRIRGGSPMLLLSFCSAAAAIGFATVAIGLPISQSPLARWGICGGSPSSPATGATLLRRNTSV